MISSRILMTFIPNSGSGLLLCTVYNTGWVDIRTRTVPEICYISFKSNENRRKKCFDSVTPSSLVTTLWGIHYIGVKTKFSQ
jgi:hypothetical protein